MHLLIPGDDSEGDAAGAGLRGDGHHAHAPDPAGYPQGAWFVWVWGRVMVCRCDLRG